MDVNKDCAEMDYGRGDEDGKKKDKFLPLVNDRIQLETAYEERRWVAIR